MCIRDRFTGDRIFDFVNVTVILLITIIILVPLLNAVSYTHLDVYKRQDMEGLKQSKVSEMNEIRAKMKDIENTKKSLQEEGFPRHPFVPFRPDKKPRTLTGRGFRQINLLLSNS